MSTGCWPHTEAQTFKQTDTLLPDTCTQLIHHPMCFPVIVCLGPPIISVVGGVLSEHQKCRSRRVCVCVYACAQGYTVPESSDKSWSHQICFLSFRPHYDLNVFAQDSRLISPVHQGKRATKGYLSTLSEAIVTQYKTALKRHSGDRSV